jgi:DNA invertase Pin-like site-specific DNA recombinase
MTQPIGYSYVRFSSKGKQAKGSSVYRQTQDTVAGESPESWCARNNVFFDTATTFRDLGESAYKGERQKELYAFVEMVRTGRVRPGSFLLVERIDRISRKGVDEGYDLCKKILKAGVSIVSLARGRVYGPDAVKGLMKGAMELQIELEQAQQYSEALSARVGAAWQLKREKARKGTLATAAMPPWLEPAGEGDGRRAVIVPEKVATVRRIFDMVIAGHGVSRVVRTLVEDGTPPIARRQAWCRTTVRRILADRTVLGEYQPRRGRGKERATDGDPIKGYFPAVVSPATFHQARACLGSRKLQNAGRESKLANVFSGLLKDARTGASYITALRIEYATKRPADMPKGGKRKDGKRHHVLLSAVKAGGSSSFPFAVFERAVLGRLSEIDPRELLPPTGEADEVLGLAGELASVEAEVEAIAAEMDREFSDVLAGVLRRKEARKKDLASRLADARLRAANPAVEAWGEAQTLLGALDNAPDQGEAKLRLRAVLRRVVESIWLLVVGRGRDRLCVVQCRFAGGEHRDSLIYHKPSKSNGKATVPGGTRARSLADVADLGPLDLRTAGDVRDLTEFLEVADLPSLWDALKSVQ